MKSIVRICHSIYELPKLTNEGTHVEGAHDNDRLFNICKTPSAFDYGTHVVCKVDDWGLG